MGRGRINTEACLSAYALEGDFDFWITGMLKNK